MSGELRQQAMRDALGQALLDLAERMPELVVLDADVASSCKTLAFGKAYPERFFNCGVAEANMVDIAAGMATCGFQTARQHVRPIHGAQDDRPSPQRRLLQQPPRRVRRRLRRSVGLLRRRESSVHHGHRRHARHAEHDSRRAGRCRRAGTGHRIRAAPRRTDLRAPLPQSHAGPV